MVDGRDSAWRNRAPRPHAHGTIARQATDGLWTEALGQQKQSNDPGNNQHILNTPTIGRRHGGGRPLGPGRQLPPPTNCWPKAPRGGGGAWRGGSRRGAGEGGSRGGGGGGSRGSRGGGGCRAPPNSWVCGPGVIRQFAPPLPTIEGRVSSAWVFPATLGTSGGWAPEAAMGLELHHATRHTYIHTKIYIYIYIYPLIYTPLPNSRWLHHTALTYVRRVQLGSYMCQKGLNWVKTGSKWARFTCLCTQNGAGRHLEKGLFDRFLTHFWSQNDPF